MKITCCDILTLQEAVKLYGNDNHKRDLQEDNAVYKTTVDYLYGSLKQRYIEVSYTFVNFIGEESKWVFICR